MSARVSWGACALALALLFTACDDADSSTGANGGRPGTGGAGAGGSDAGAAGELGTALVPCLERPGELQRAPSGGLPCELLPPDFAR